LLVNKVYLSLNILVLMATGSEGNESQIQPGYGDCIWGTGRVTVYPPGPGATQRLSLAGTVADQDGCNQSGNWAIGKKLVAAISPPHVLTIW